MKINFRCIFVFLALGVVANVLVAWVIALTVDYDRCDGFRTGFHLDPSSPDDHTGWKLLRLEGFGTSWYIAKWQDYFPSQGLPTAKSPDWNLGMLVDEFFSALQVSSKGSGLATHCDGHAFLRGWPFRSFMCVVRENPTGVGTVGILAIDSHLRDGYDVRYLPLRPILPGVVINTIVYAIVLRILWIGPQRVQRVLRRSRGKCVACGYDLRGNSQSPECPECGTSRS